MQNDKKLIQGTPEWLEFRRQGVFASDSPVIMGVSPWKTSLQLFWDKINGTAPIKNASMERGLNLEEEARHNFEMLTGHFVTPRVILMEHGEWLGASVDGINDDGILVEIKCPGNEDHELALQGVIPKKYYPQLQTQMLVCKLFKMYYFSYRPEHSEPWALIEVNRDHAYVGILLPKLKEFYDCLVKRTPPTLSEVESMKSQIGAVKHSDDEAFLIQEERLAYLLHQIKEMQQEADEIKASMVEACGDNTTMGFKLKFTPIVSKGAVDYSAIPQLRGIDLEVYRKQPRRSWRIDFL